MRTFFKFMSVFCDHMRSAHKMSTTLCRLHFLWNTRRLIHGSSAWIPLTFHWQILLRTRYHGSCRCRRRYANYGSSWGWHVEIYDFIFGCRGTCRRQIFMCPCVKHGSYTHNIERALSSAARASLSRLTMSCGFAFGKSPISNLGTRPSWSADVSLVRHWCWIVARAFIACGCLHAPGCDELIDQFVSHRWLGAGGWSWTSIISDLSSAVAKQFRSFHRILTVSHAGPISKSCAVLSSPRLDLCISLDQNVFVFDDKISRGHDISGNCCVAIVVLDVCSWALGSGEGDLPSIFKRAQMNRRFCVMRKELRGFPYDRTAECVLQVVHATILHESAARREGVDWVEEFARWRRER